MLEILPYHTQDVLKSHGLYSPDALFHCPIPLVSFKGIGQQTAQQIVDILDEHTIDVTLKSNYGTIGMIKTLYSYDEDNQLLLLYLDPSITVGNTVVHLQIPGLTTITLPTVLNVQYTISQFTVPLSVSKYKRFVSYVERLKQNEQIHE